MTCQCAATALKTDAKSQKKKKILSSPFLCLSGMCE